MHFKSIQLLRGLAAIYIVLYHVNYFWNKTSGSLSNIFDHGYAAVDLFFVISGFVIAQSLDKLNFGFKSCYRFLERRFTRIYLFYWIFLLLFYVTGLVDFKNIDVANFIKTLLLFPGHENIIVISWTLPYEIYFYFLLGLYVLHKRFIYLSITVFILSCITFINNVLINADTPVLHLGFYNEFVLEFFLGLIAKHVYLRMSLRISIISLLGGVVLFFLLPVQNLASNVIRSGLPSVLILLGLVNLELKGKINIPAILVLLGDASYILYLIHGPFISKVLFSLDTKVNTGMGIIITAVIITILVAVIVHQYFEKPLLIKLRKLINS